MKRTLITTIILFGLSNLIALVLDSWNAFHIRFEHIDVAIGLGLLTPILFTIYLWKYRKELSKTESAIAWIVGIFIVLPHAFMGLVFLLFIGDDVVPFG